jgi:hypothetical protein
MQFAPAERVVMSPRASAPAMSHGVPKTLRIVSVVKVLPLVAADADRLRRSRPGRASAVPLRRSKGSQKYGATVSVHSTRMHDAAGVVRAC